MGPTLLLYRSIDRPKILWALQYNNLPTILPKQIIRGLPYYYIDRPKILWGMGRLLIIGGVGALPRILWAMGKAEVGSNAERATIYRAYCALGILCRRRLGVGYHSESR